MQWNEIPVRVGLADVRACRRYYRLYGGDVRAVSDVGDDCHRRAVHFRDRSHAAVGVLFRRRRRTGRARVAEYKPLSDSEDCIGDAHPRPDGERGDVGHPAAGHQIHRPVGAEKRYADLYFAGAAGRVYPSTA